MKHSHSIQSRKILSQLSLLIVASGCGSKLENSALPKPASEMTVDDVTDPDTRAANKRWADLSAALKIVNNGTSAALTTPSGYFDSTPDAISAYSTLSESLATEHLKSAVTTECGSIESFELIGKAKSIDWVTIFPSDIDSAQWYLMKYKRKKSDGTLDSVTNGALVSVPTSTAKTYPVIAYGHAGDRGLSALEIAAIFGDLQASHFIVAPAFPGESICKFGTSNADKKSCDSSGRYFDAVGDSSPYSTDAEDLLAAHNCLVTPNSRTDFATTVTGRIKTQSPAGLSVGAVPVSYIAGSSRGGMTSLLALAKNGAMLNANQKAGSTKYSQAKYFNCAATNINPTTFAYGEFRVFLEAVVKGTAQSMDVYKLPTAPQLNDLLASYRTGAISTADAALMLQMRDATFNAGLALTSLRNWTTSLPGAFLSLHGTLDASIPFSQGLIGAKVFNAVNVQMITQNQSNPALPPGANFTNLGTIAQAPYSSDGGKTLNAGFTMHGDLAWFSSLVGVNAALTDTAGVAVELDSADPLFNKKPVDAFKAWITSSTRGCLTSVTP